MSVYTETLFSSFVLTIPAEVNFGDIFICGLLISISLAGLALIAVEVFS